MWMQVDSCGDEAGVLFGRLDNGPLLGAAPPRRPRACRELRQGRGAQEGVGLREAVRGGLIPADSVA
jgi:hypothetical protein